MFRVPFIEKYLSRVRPWHVLTAWLPVAAWLAYVGFRDPGITSLECLGSILLGIFIWTFLEYLLHRFLFHFKFSKDSEVQRDLGFLIHGIHHDYPWDADRLVMPPAIAVVIAVGLWFPFHAAFGPHLFYPVFSGTVLGYLWYDLTHYATHHHVPVTALGKAQRRYHLTHHFASPDRRYGVTTPLWDYVFGTHPAKDEARSSASSAEATHTGSNEAQAT
jgi:sterol desaturase/sphingolipid hydroxylase (fatty acid hydroxylase superfamily)